MDAFKTHKEIIEEYKNYLQSFIDIKDNRIKEVVLKAFSEHKFLPEPLIQFNPSFSSDRSLKDLINEGKAHPELLKIFGAYNLYVHQVEALEKGFTGESFIVTSGTGSGKSLTFLATIFNNILNIQVKQKGIKAILVYPMNALINSQEEEIKKYEINYLKTFCMAADLIGMPDENNGLDEVITFLKSKTSHRFPVSYSRYTGQEDKEKREKVHDDLPDIILTNYMMLELIMTRKNEQGIRDSLKSFLQYLVFDELHTYRGRQGSDVAMLVRRINAHISNKLVYIGTSATMASGGSRQEKKESVAKVAFKIFGHAFSTDQVIGETLDNCTQGDINKLTKFDLQEAIQNVSDIAGDASKFIFHPLAVWLESRIALEKNNDKFIERGKPKSFSSISKLLSEESGEMLESCKQALNKLLKWSEQLNIEAVRLKTRKSYLPFKIHQFISQTGSVYVTLEPKESRYITVEDGVHIRKDKIDQPIFPVLFSRYSGHEFICVTKDFENKKLKPRDPYELPRRITKDELKADSETGMSRKILKEEDFPMGYIIIPNEGEDLWNDEERDNLPDTWFKTKKGSIELDDFYFHRVPSKIYFDRFGNYSNKQDFDIWAWYIPARLLFDPTSGVIFDLRTSENTKLMRLGNEGRSTATTIISYNILKELHGQGEGIERQKLLSFTDNRQDASLQSGHFNDFLTIGRLRSAIYHALKKSPGNQLTIDGIAETVFKVLSLKEDEYARIPAEDPKWPNPKNESALKEYLLVRILYDLKKGWRYNTPNLEQCGLLFIDYFLLNEVASDEDSWAKIELLKDYNPEERIDFVVQLLNFFRTSYAFDYNKLNEDHIFEMENRLKERLHEDKLWSLDKNEKIDRPFYLMPRLGGKKPKKTYTSGLGHTSYMGKYIRKLFYSQTNKKLSKEDYLSFIDSVLDVLVKRHFISKEIIKGGKSDEYGYRLHLDSVIWKLGDGKTVFTDKVRINSHKPIEQKANNYFKKFYQQDFSKYNKTFEGREHTGQLGNVDRIDRENRFRSGELSALFCSPTMELGIDIASLNIVHMRNVPPNPANYAQRGGRAGRSGQTALVFTYCSGGSPHDRNYFKDPVNMVAGVVSPPQIDLINKELISSHLHAFVMMELRLDLIQSVSELIDLEKQAELPMKSAINSFIQDQLDRYHKDFFNGFKQTLSDIKDELDKSYWYSDEWLLLEVKNFLNDFDKSLDRWRTLYKGAIRLLEIANSKIQDPTLAADNTLLREARDEQKVGLDKRAKLLNIRSFESNNNQSEFYIFRYLAAEGFLPGYNFTRLPIRSYLGYRSQDQGEFISRPRFMALKEFGPQNTIYHNGGKFRIVKMQPPEAEIKSHQIRICRKTGYVYLNDEGKGINNDPITNQPLKGEDTIQIRNNMVEMSEAEAIPIERISCEEEERTSTGYDIQQYFSVPQGFEHCKKVMLKADGQDILQLIYAPAARLLQINKKWRNSTDTEGFAIHRTNGTWMRKKDLEDQSDTNPSMNIQLYTTDTADILYIQPIEALGLEGSAGAITLMYALKRAIEKKSQAEENEIGTWLMGEGEMPNIMIFESAEGSLGILSQLVENTELLKIVFKEAYQICYFDPETREDSKPDLPKASYDDLLSYYNQRHHDKIDRYSIKIALEKLMNCEPDNAQHHASWDKQYEYLLKHYDKQSVLEKKLFDYLYKNGLKLPDIAQFNIPEYYINADFVYKDERALIFCDGSVHDNPEQKNEDSHKRQLLIDAGYDVIVWHYMEPIEKLVERRKDIFRKVR
ncbi:MAG: DEAD/DEAH box helicase [Bacteroidales bacterium]